MDQARISNMSPGPCEKIFRAFNIIPAFKAIRRISDPAKSSIPSPLPAADTAAKAKLVAQQQPNSVVPVIIESIVVHPPPLKEKEKQVRTVTAKSNGKMAEQEKKFAETAKKAAQSSEGKLKPGSQMPKLSNVSQEAAKTPHISSQVKPVPRVETVSPAKPLVEQGQQKVVTIDNSREQDSSKTVLNSGDHRFTDFINRTMLKIRTTSDVGKSGSVPDGVQIKKKSSSNFLGGKSISFKK